MKRILLFVCIQFFLLASFAGETINFCKSWKFHLGDAGKGASSSSYNDSQWRILNIPHDWSIEGTYKQFENGTDWQSGFLPAGISWYRKTFTIPSKWKNKKVQILFEGVYLNSEVWINGHWLGKRPNGYISFVYDLTPYLQEGKNQIAVKVDHSKALTGRWYTGSGIYRPVYLLVSNPTHIPYSGIHFRSKLQNKQSATYTLSIEIETQEKKPIKVKTYLQAPNGSIADTSEKIFVPSADSLCFLSGSIRKPLLWSPDSPNVYTLICQLTRDNKILDECRLPVGFRQLEFNPVSGFLLNGKSLKIKGVCDHHTAGAVGAAVPDDLLHYRLKLLKDMGCNAIRTSHNPFSPAFYNLCDTMGIMVLNEGLDGWNQPKAADDYGNYFDEWWQKDMTDFIKRDRNHPSIIMWSIVNEVEQRADEPEGDLISKRLVNTVRKYDTSRFTTIGSNDFWDRRQFSWDKDSYRIFKNLDVAGYNYIWWKYESDHAAYPDRVIYGSESYPKEAAQNWNLVEKHPYVIGDFVWTAIDYLGEAGLAHALYLKEGEHDTQFMGWPWYNGWCGDIDLCGDKKPQSYYRDVLWRERPITMAVHAPVPEGKKEVVNGWGWPNELVSWNWTSCEGKVMKVNVYSRSPKVKLYLNDKLIGEKETGKENYTATFDVPYEPGTLKAVNSKGKEEFVLKTAGAPAAIRLIADRSKIKACKNDLSYVKIELVDKNGNVVPETSLPVKIECTGKGTVIAGGNAAYADMESFRSLTPNTFRGKAIAIVQPDGEKGDIQVKVSAKGLEDASIVITAY